MACDMVAALAHTTPDGCSLLGHNCNRPEQEPQLLLRQPGRAHALGETIHTAHLELPQARQTWAVLGCRSAGAWGVRHGVNERGVAAGCTAIHTRLRAESPALTAPDLVRIALERAASARQAVDLVTDLVTRHGQGAYAGCPAEDDHDSALLVLDCHEAYLVETAGSNWALQEVAGVRAATGVAHIRQDWDGLSRGLADLAIHNGWWPEDGSKLDFAGAVCWADADEAAALRRYGRATMLLEDQIGRLDAHTVRCLLADHFDGCSDEIDPCGSGPIDRALCRHGRPADAPRGVGTAASLVAQLPGDPARPVVAWCGFGPPCTSLYFPLVPDAEIPAAFERTTEDGLWRRMMRLMNWMRRDRGWYATVRRTLARTQERLDQNAEEFVAEATALRRAGEQEEYRGLAGSFMQHNLELFEEVWTGLDDQQRAGLGFVLSAR